MMVGGGLKVSEEVREQLRREPFEPTGKAAELYKDLGSFKIVAEPNNNIE